MNKINNRNQYPVFLFLLTAVFLSLFIYLLFSFSAGNGISDHPMPEKVAKSKYPQYKSRIDTDGDGIDDQTDILASARAYIEIKPQYKSKYYSTGYPTDKHGVCTDVIAFALKGAGYDLRELMDKDIAKAPDAYGIAPGSKDKNIDFRRVVNQNVYFKRHAISLTTDVTKYAKWQGGDIVVFKNHVALVSDKRNKNGVPYIIQLSNPVQTGMHDYEQNQLEKRKRDVIGHYRIS